MGAAAAVPAIPAAQVATARAVRRFFGRGIG
jgi:hypothetical protein